MSEKKIITVLLLGCGGMLFLIGAMATYIWLPPQQVVVESETNTETTPAPDVGADTNTISALAAAPDDYEAPTPDMSEIITLPEPDRTGALPVAAALAGRRSNRSYADTALSLEDLGQMLWAGTGVSDADEGLRTVPSRGEAYPVGTYVYVDRVAELESGLYFYMPETHSLGRIDTAAVDTETVWNPITGQPHPQNAAAVLLLTLDMSAGESHRQTNYQESGHVGQNLYLQATELGLYMLVMGGFDREAAHSYLGLDEFQQVVYLVPMGNPSS